MNSNKLLIKLTRDDSIKITREMLPDLKKGMLIKFKNADGEIKRAGYLLEVINPHTPAQAALVVQSRVLWRLSYLRYDELYIHVKKEEREKRFRQRLGEDNIKKAQDKIMKKLQDEKQIDINYILTHINSTQRR